jgi:trehalose-6-phosphate synthase
MKLALRFIIPLVVVIGFLVVVGEQRFTELQERWSTRDLESKSTLISHFIQDQLQVYLRGKTNRANDFLTHLAKDENLQSVGVCSRDGVVLVKSEKFPKDVDCFELSKITNDTFLNRQLSVGRTHIGAFPFNDTYSAGIIVTVTDMSFVTSRSRIVERYVIIAFVILSIIVIAMTTWFTELSWRGWLTSMRTLVSGFRGVSENPKQVAKLDAYSPIVKDLRKLVRDLEARRVARDETMQTWTSQILKDILHEELSDEQVLIVSNREPFIHQKTDHGMILQRPASGLVTALEPIMEACSGVWIAHGSGSGDRDMVDDHDKIKVPPEKPTYSLRRVWLTEDEERGYYYGFANEGLWPLCHIAHTRPIFRSEDFEYYTLVNQRFADVICDEAKSEEPVILIQDYHFALLPRMIRKRLPKAVIVTFWHIPWPNPEVFGICPWREELIDGLLGSSIVGFHTQFHCNNFFETVDRFMESRIDREGSAVSYMGELTGVKPYPISIEWPPKWLESQVSIPDARAQIREHLKLPADIKLGIGVDRLDYTKGILERFLTVENLFKLYPEWIGKFSFIQIAAPSRVEIPSYKQLRDQVVETAQRLNDKYSSEGYKPIILMIEHHEPPSVYKYLRAADICYVSSLHDGMNLVAKEFIASREDEQGVLILSSFTGASRELPEALIVNPYNIDQAAESLNLALIMSRREQQERMKAMRSLVSEYNVYRWAGRMLLDAASIKKRNKFNRWVNRRRFAQRGPS